MIRKKSTMMIALSLLFSLTQSLMAANSTGKFKDLVAQLQKSPDDTELRKKIIKISLTTPPPAMPDEVDELFGKAKYIVKQAKSPENYKDAVDAFKQASLLAPWAGDIYYNLAVVQEKAGEPQDAIASYKWYLFAKPHAKDKKAVQEKIGALGYMAVEKKRDLTGAKWHCVEDSVTGRCLNGTMMDSEVVCSSNELVETFVVTKCADPNGVGFHGNAWKINFEGSPQGKKFTIPPSPNTEQYGPATVEISADGQTITYIFPAGMAQIGPCFSPIVWTRE